MPPRLWPDADAVRARADGDLREQPPAPCIDGVDDVVPPARQPENRAVGRHVPHVGAAAAGDAPGLHDAARSEADDRDASLAAVRHVEEARVAARVEAVRAAAGRDEAEDHPAVAVDLPDA